MLRNDQLQYLVSKLPTGPAVTAGLFETFRGGGRNMDRARAGTGW